jgi:DNA-binding NtrC family response regulator
MEKELAGFAPAALAALAAHPFPGNVRELRNVVEHAAVVAAGPLVGREHLALEESVGAGAAAGPAVAPGGAPALAAPSPVPGAGPGGVAVGSGGGAGGSAAIGAGAGTAAGGAGAGAAAGAITLALPDARLETAERELIAVVLRMVGGNRRKAAEKLGINRSTLYAKLKLYGLGGGEPGESRDGEGAEGEG